MKRWRTEVCWRLGARGLDRRHPAMMAEVTKQLWKVAELYAAVMER